ncbi:type IV secretory pathway VirB10-like protein [Inquilinus ginsengisoli]|uniref:Type IV secretory pathway VirB10-like protein n=1 Tax=Inquilinus ginsengisoli TaxID=363840 RepID=A0ABU1JZQ3_9PROT|nr:TrbI/VirB10 family protein [Inquilinus ginsengisoli]MDR6293813.1 type IV secretory pathway VirB10-like protein [Inquilinus ginsengisoli]
MRFHLAAAALALMAPAIAIAQPRDSLDGLRREIEGVLNQQAQASQADQSPPDRGPATDPAPGSAPAPSEDLSREDPTKPTGFNAVTATPYGYNGPTAKIAVGTIASAVVNMMANSDYPGPWRATLTQPLMNIDRSAIIAPTGSTVVGMTQRSSGPNEPINNRLVFTPLMIVLPDSRTIPLIGQYQLDGSGIAGVRDKVDYHFDIQAAAVGGSSIADALPGVIAEALGVDSASRIRDTVVSNLSDNGKAILERYTQLVPTVEIRPGAPVNIFFMRETIAPVWRAPERYSFQRPRR